MIQVNHGIILLSPKQKCILCNSKLYIRSDRFALAVLYDDKLGTLPAIHYTRYCRKSGCSFQQHYGYYTCGSLDDVIYNDDALDLSYFMCSRETGFTTKLLIRFDSDCLIGQISYKQSAEIYNHYNNYEEVYQPVNQEMTDEHAMLTLNGLNSRLRMDRRRLECAHVRYAMLRVVQWYPCDLNTSKILFHSNPTLTLLEFTPLFQALFHRTYSGHRCSVSGCGTVLVVDGNMKNHRSVCAASEAGYIEYDGLPGQVKTGCTNTPEQKNRFCSLHKPRALTCSHNSSNTIIESILEKKTTRSVTHYKVLWLGVEDCYATWELEKHIPSQLIKEFEESALLEIDEISSKSVGQTSKILNITRSDNAKHQLKKSKIDRTTIDMDNGAFASNSEDVNGLHCNTEKDKIKLHDRSAGLLAGIWPCGIITILDELFKTESKAQVYGCLHGFVHCNRENTADIATLCYDDGCHLRKYSRNPLRAKLTDVATIMSRWNIVIDKMHFSGHSDPWCRENCNPNNVKELDKVCNHDSRMHKFL